MLDPSRDSTPRCLRCAALEREVRRLRLQARQDLDDLEDARGDIRSLRRAVHRLRRRLDALEDTSRGDDHAEDPAP